MYNEMGIWSAYRKQRADAFAVKMRREIDGMKAEGLFQRQMLLELNCNVHRAASGCILTQIHLRRVLKRLEEISVQNC